MRRIIQRLRQNQIIYPVPFVNPATIGLATYQVFITVPTPGVQALQQLENYLRKSQQVVWVSGLGSEYNFDVMILARHIVEVADFLNSIRETLPKVDFKATVAGETRFTYYPPRYLSEDVFDSPYLEISASAQPVELSEHDHTILRALIDFPDLSQSQISQKVHFPPSTLQHRIQQMRKKGVIQGFGYMVRPFAVRVSPFIYLLHAKRRSAALHDQLHEFALSHRAVTFLVEQVGDWDYQIGARFLDAHESVVFLATLHDRFGALLAQIRPIPVLESTKFEAYPLKTSE